MICPNCKNEVSDTAKVCGHCGHRLAGGPATAPTARRGMPGWAWGVGGGLFGVVAVAALFLSGVIALPAGDEATSAPSTLAPAPTAVPPTATNPLPTETVPLATPTPAPETETPVPTTTPEGLVCRDDFVNGSFWPRYDSPNLTAAYGQPGYRIAISATAEAPSSEIVIHPSGSSACNVPLGIVRVKMVGFVEPGSAPSTSVGLTVRGDSNWKRGTLAFYVRPFLGDYSVGRREPDRPPSWVVGFTESPEVKLAADGTLALEVEARGNDFTFWVNGELVEAIEVDMPAEGFVGIGLAVANDGWAKFVVTDFEVWRLP